MTDQGSQAAGVTHATRDGLWVGLASLLWLSAIAAQDVGEGDAGEIGAAAVALGVAHPTGFAIDLLWLKLATLVPLGSLAVRQSFGTAVLAAAALGTLAVLVLRTCARIGVGDRSSMRMGAIAAAIGLGTWATFVGSARVVEVYSTALLAVLAGLLASSGAARRARAVWLLLGLCVGLHVTAGLYVLGLALAEAYGAHKRRGLVRGVLARGLLLSVGAAIVSYLPLASLRDPAIDWGDPETPSALFSHLTAARIRDAFGEEMLGGRASAWAELASQLGELSWLLAPALVVVLLSVRLAPRWLALGLSLLAIDFAYGVLIHPMGVAQRQVGHVAGALLCVLGGTGIAFLLSRARALAASRGGLSRAVPAVAIVIIGLACSAAVLSLRSALADRGFALGELLGSGGLLARLPPRAVLVCSNDDTCAVAMFALHAELARPDVDVVPAQHAWDPTVLRHVEGMRSLALKVSAAPPPSLRRAVADARMRRMLETQPERPVALESADIARRVGVRGDLGLLDALPFARRSLQKQARLDPAFDTLERMRRARLGASMTAVSVSDRARGAWSRAYGEVGSAALEAGELDLALDALRAGAEIAPRRAAAWVNLGIVLERRGELTSAIAMTERALSIEPKRASAWLSLARLHARAGNVSRARELLDEALRLGVIDPRLDGARRSLGP